MTHFRMYKTIQVFFGFFAILAMARIAYAQQFPDVRGTPYEQAFAYLSSKGAVNGYSDGMVFFHKIRPPVIY